MKTTVALLLCLTASAAFAKSGGHSASSSHTSGSTVHVRSYTGKNGEYHQPSVRTTPDHTQYNNYTTNGNVNPYTGKEGTKTPDR